MERIVQICATQFFVWRNGRFFKNTAQFRRQIFVVRKTSFLYAFWIYRQNYMFLIFFTLADSDDSKHGAISIRVYPKNISTSMSCFQMFDRKLGGICCSLNFVIAMKNY